MGPSLLVTGGSGFLGGAVVARAARDWRVSSTWASREPLGAPAVSYRLDLADADAVRRVVESAQPAVVIHTAIPRDEAAFDDAIVRGSETLARQARAVGARLVHVSTDMVVDGDHAPYDEDAPTSPITAYGRAKAEAERRVRQACPGAVIARLPLLYALDPPDPRGAKMASDLEAGKPITLFTDERRSPAEVGDVAQALLEVAGRLARHHELPPVIHLGGPEVLTRWEFGISFLEALGLSTEGVRAQPLAESGLVRPRDLTLVSRRTPPEITRGLRPFATVAAALR
jgi:dTDP-4-dehydrorhamnose reductase